MLYNIQVLENLLGSGDVSVAAINSAGHVVGKSATGALGSDGYPIHHAFLYVNGTVIDLGTLGGERSEATDINGAGDIVGISDTGSVDANGDPTSHAFLYKNGKMTSLGTLGGPNSQPTAVNSFGVVVGSAETDEGIIRAFSWTPDSNGNVNGVMTNLGSLEDDLSSFALGINDNGTIVGYCPKGFGGDGFVIYPGGKMTKLNCAYARSVNAEGDIAGGELNSALEIREKGNLQTLENLMNELNSAGFSPVNIATSIRSLANEMDDNGNVVGTNVFFAGITPPGTDPDLLDLPDTYDHAVIWPTAVDGGPVSPYDLNDLLDQPPDPDWYLSTANCINNQGRIVGNRFRVGIDPSSAPYPPGSISGFILTPDASPQPSRNIIDGWAWVSILFGILGDGGGGYRTPDGVIHRLGPIGPADPGPNLALNGLAAGKRDILAGLAIDAAAQLIANPAARLGISRAAISLVQRSAARLAGGIEIEAVAPMARPSLRPGGLANRLNKHFTLGDRGRRRQDNKRAV